MAKVVTHPKFKPSLVVDRLKQGLEVTRNQRERENASLKFMDPKFQWSNDAISAREGTNLGGATVPARPRLSVSKIQQPIQLVQNGFQNANLDVNIHPLSPGAEKKTAEIFQGIYRQIVRDSNAIIPRSWAFSRAIQAGFGVYRILTEYDPSSDVEEDQKIIIKRIRDQAAVIFDPAADEPDYSDGRFAFVTSYMRKLDFQAQYPNAKIATADEGTLLQVMKERPEWVDFDNETKGVLVAEYFERYGEGEKIWWYKLCSGTSEELEVLDAREWNGQYIPLIPVIGTEEQPFDRERRYIGIVEPSMDAQRGFNYAITNAIELAALEPKAPFVGGEGQFDGHEQKWNTANTRNWPYIEYRPTSFEGNLLPPPQRMQVDASRLQVSMILMDRFDQAIQATTHTPDPALGKHSRDESGKAIEALQSQSIAATSNFMSNMAQISMMLEAKVIMDMIPRIYNRPGRIVRIVDVQDETEEVMLNQPFVTDPNTGRPTDNVQSQPNQTPETYDLTKGKYGVSISIGKSYQSRFEQGKDQLAELLQAHPDLIQTLGDIFFKYNDAPWANEAEKRMKKLIKRNNPEFFQPDKPGQETPEQLRAMLEASGAQIQQLQQQLQMATQAIQTDMAKQKATIEKANIDAQARLQQQQVGADADAKMAAIESAVKVKLQQMQEESDAKIEMLRETAETERLLMEQRFKALQAELDRRQEQQMAEHAARMAEAAAERESAQEDREEGGEE